jgi:hypothetical protein
MAAGAGLTTLAIGLCATLVATDAEAAARKRVRAPSDPLIVRGCTHYLPPVCLGVTSGLTTYSLFSAGPSLPAGVGVDVYGHVGGLSPCLTTTNVIVTSWRPNRMRC